MTTQDIYSWAQMGLQVLVGGGVMVGIYRYYGVLKRLIEGQEKTIAAQAEQMKAQSTVLQDFERLNKVMQQVVDIAGDPAALQREQAYKARMDRDVQDLLKRMQTAFEDTLKQSTAQTQEQTTQAFSREISGVLKLIYNLLPFVAPELRQTLIKAAGLPTYLKEQLQELARSRPYISTSEQWEQYRHNPLLGLLTDAPLPQNFPGEPP